MYQYSNDNGLYQALLISLFSTVTQYGWYWAITRKNEIVWWIPKFLLWREPLCHHGNLISTHNIANTKTKHYNDVIIGEIASQITSLTIVYSTVNSDADQRKHQSSTSLAFVWGIHRDRRIPRTKGQLRGKCFHLMTSSWNTYQFPTQYARVYPSIFTSYQCRFAREMQWSPVDSLLKGLVILKGFPCQDVFMCLTHT